MTLEKPDFSCFESTVQVLFSRTRGHIEPGAHRMQRLLPQDLLMRLWNIPTILVGGTNGKGTTCAVLEKTLRDAGHRTALYTSPHIVSPTERIRIQGRPVSEELFLHSALRAFERAQHYLPDATFFELMTALSFEIISEANVDFFVCEVGLGGRLDSTNVLSPQVSVLTSVGLDHTEWLGDKEQLIAFEKSFISRRNRPFVVGPVSSSAKEGIFGAIAKTQSQPIFVDIPESKDEQLVVSLQTVEVCNAVLDQLKLRCNLRLSEDAVQNSVRKTRWPGRFDIRFVNHLPVLFDAAHNSHGIQFFLRRCEQTLSLKELPRPWTLVYASLADKDWRESLKLLKHVADQIILTQTQSTRAVSAEVMLEFLETLDPHCQSSTFPASNAAVNEALKVAAAQKGTLVILGSITLIGEVMEQLRLPVITEFEPEFSCAD